jgi:hypothetical protein
MSSPVPDSGLRNRDELESTVRLRNSAFLYRRTQPHPVSIKGWSLWIDIARFCEKAPEDFAAIAEDLDFSRLDD